MCDCAHRDCPQSQAAVVERPPHAAHHRGRAALARARSRRHHPVAARVVLLGGGPLCVGGTADPDLQRRRRARTRSCARWFRRHRKELLATCGRRQRRCVLPTVESFMCLRCPRPQRRAPRREVGGASSGSAASLKCDQADVKYYFARQPTGDAGRIASEANWACARSRRCRRPRLHGALAGRNPTPAARTRRAAGRRRLLPETVPWSPVEQHYQLDDAPTAGRPGCARLPTRRCARFGIGRATVRVRGIRIYNNRYRNELHANGKIPE